MWKRGREGWWKGGKGERKNGGKVEKEKSPGYYNQYPGDRLFYRIIYRLKFGGLQIHRNKRGANVYKY